MLTGKSEKTGQPPSKGVQIKLAGDRLSEVERIQMPVLGLHQYAETLQEVKCYGGEGYLSVHHPFVRRQAWFSLGQITLANCGSKREHVSAHAAAKSKSASQHMQTVEAGWQKWKTHYGDWQPHLFVYYTTNGYNNDGDNQGGYNQDVNGWVQVSKTIYPGVALTSAKKPEDVKHVIHLKYKLHENRWWLACNGEWVGYYPARLFHLRNPASLESNADHVAFYGEVATEVGPGRSGTQLGIGDSTGDPWRLAAYMRNLRYQSHKGGRMRRYKGKRVSEPSDKPFELITHFDGEKKWGSYFRYGGRL